MNVLLCCLHLNIFNGNEIVLMTVCSIENKLRPQKYYCIKGEYVCLEFSIVKKEKKERQTTIEISSYFAMSLHLLFGYFCLPYKTVFKKIKHIKSRIGSKINSSSQFIALNVQWFMPLICSMDNNVGIDYLWREFDFQLSVMTRLIKILNTNMIFSISSISLGQSSLNTSILFSVINTSSSIRSTFFLNTWAAAKAFPNLKHMASYNVSNDGRS
ncbi:hypothetical protein AGLY_010723 [Aphis glycines]|uniref:Uncharacterized protein n=1 Tax=Aphis glycines TaxID=307491 RepID=A0A6G0TGK0_APHGL|nr:hypothetical protein AGLY_010723 [Aphis glycines]